MPSMKMVLLFAKSQNLTMVNLPAELMEKPLDSHSMLMSHLMDSNSLESLSNLDIMILKLKRLTQLSVHLRVALLLT
jgi:hypothetical protein